MLLSRFLHNFWKKVDKTSSPHGCWLWTASKKDGYGQVGYYTAKLFGVSQLAHVTSWILCRGPVPKGKNVCHDCPGGDNRACVNPDHLWIGSQKDNVIDTVKKGKHGAAMHPESMARGSAHGSKTCPESVLRGVNNPNANLTPKIVRAIRRRYAKGNISIADVGRIYGLGDVHTGQIIRRKLWAHI